MTSGAGCAPPPALVGHLFPGLLSQGGYNTRLRDLAPLLEAALRWLTGATPATGPSPGSASRTRKLHGERDQGRQTVRDQPSNRPAPGTLVVTGKGLSGQESEDFSGWAAAAGGVAGGTWPVQYMQRAAAIGIVLRHSRRSQVVTG